jgi:Hypervirulence associated proteins TUDOR domain
VADEFKKGDHVQWESSGGTSKGKVVRKLTEPTDIHDFHVAASPRYLVESESSGKQAAHKPEALTRVNG